MLTRALIGNWHYFVMGYHEHNWFHQCQEDINSLYHFERILRNIPGAYVSLETELIQCSKYHVNPKTDKIKIKISADGSKVSRISNFVVLFFSVIIDDLTLSSTDQHVFLHCELQRRLWSFKTCLQTHFSENKHIMRKNKYWSWGEHFDLNILMGGDMKFLQLVLGLGGSLCNYSCPWYRVHKNHKRAD